MDKTVKYQTITLTKEQIRARRSRAIGICLALGFLILVLYAASLARLLESA